MTKPKSEPTSILDEIEEEDCRITARRLSRAVAFLLDYMAKDTEKHIGEADLESVAELAWQVERNLARLDDSILAREIAVADGKIAGSR